MSFDIRNLRWLRSLDTKNLPETFGRQLYELITDHITATRNIESQTNSNGGGYALPPPPPDGLSVVAQNGVFHVSVQHNTQSLFRGVNYHLEYSTDPGFASGGFPVDLGSAREHRGYYGNLSLYWRAAASYAISPPSRWVYFGGPTPQAVQGGGVTGPALPAQSQGSGTGTVGQGLQGPGQAAFRSKTGVPPVRGLS